MVLYRQGSCCSIPGGVQGGVGQGLEQAGLLEGVPASFLSFQKSCVHPEPGLVFPMVPSMSVSFRAELPMASGEVLSPGANGIEIASVLVMESGALSPPGTLLLCSSPSHPQDGSDLARPQV